MVLEAVRVAKLTEAQAGRLEARSKSVPITMTSVITMTSGLNTCALVLDNPHVCSTSKVKLK